MNVYIKKEIKKRVHDDSIVTSILKGRGITEIESFINPPHPRTITLQSFFKNTKRYKKDWKKTADLLAKIKKNKEMVVVYTDYDADGITGGAILWKTLDALGFKTMPYVPDRKKEGYGFSVDGIMAVKDMYKPSLIISVDHGIVAEEQINYAKEVDIPIIITDHHQKKEHVPKNAYAIFHIPELSGSGVSYFFSKEVAKTFKRTADLKDLFETDFLALASIGTVADLVPLTGASRSIVKYGLKALEKVKQHGLKQLIKEAGIKDRNINTYDIGYLIAPRINAFGRLAQAIDALRLLCTTSSSRARSLAKLANTTNMQRQNLVQKAVDAAVRMAKTSKNIIILHNDKWEEGIIGLVAGKLLNMYYKPAIVISGSNGVARGSARSVPDLNITDFLRLMEKYFIDLGGHAAAAGFSIEKKNIPVFMKKAEKLAEKKITKKMLRRSYIADIGTSLSNISIEVARQIEKLEPFGVGNETPLFYSKAFIKDIQYMGKNREHIRLLLKDGDLFYKGIYFNGIEKGNVPDKDSEITVLYSLNINRWNDKEYLDLVVKHIER